VNRIEALIRVFNRHGNRENKNKARLKFVLRERGFDWVRNAVEEEYSDILSNGGIEVTEAIPEGFGGFQSEPQPPGLGSALPVLNGNGARDPEFERWEATNVAAQKQDGYAVVTIRVEQGNLTGSQMRGVAALARDAGDGLVRITIGQNLMLASVARANLKRVFAALRRIGLAGSGAYGIGDITTCPGAYSCALGLTKSMNLGSALEEAVRGYDDPAVRRLSIKVSGCPNSCGQHWIADLGFYGNARKIEGREVPYYQMLLGGGFDQDGMVRFGLQVQSIAARLAPVAVRRVLDHYSANRIAGETFRDYVLRTRVETFRELTNDLAKPPEIVPEMYKDWGDNEQFSLKLGRGECAA